MSRYIDADGIQYTMLYKENWITNTGVEKQGVWKDDIDKIPTADVRKNVHAKKVIGGSERDGATCWFECSSCHGSVDIEDAYCKHCGAVLEYEK